VSQSGSWHRVGSAPEAAREWLCRWRSGGGSAGAP